MTDFYSQNRCVCSTRSHGPLLCAFCLSFHFKWLCRLCHLVDTGVEWHSGTARLQSMGGLGGLLPL